MQVLENINNNTISHASKMIPITIQKSDDCSITLTYTGSCFIKVCPDSNDLSIIEDGKVMYKNKISDSNIIPFLNGQSELIVFGKKFSKLLSSILILTLTNLQSYGYSTRYYPNNLFI